MKLAERIFRRTDYYLTSPFGNRIMNGRTEFHNGSDYGTNRQNWPQYTLENGTVLSAGRDGTGANFAWVRYPRIGLDLLHYHLDIVKVKTGQSVTEKTVIGNTGTTGYSTGIHLHLGLRRSGTTAYIDPHAYNYTLASNSTAATSTSTAATSTTAKTPSVPTASTAKAKTYKVVTKLKGYLTADDAANAKNPKNAVNVGTYYVFNEKNDAINVSTKQGTPGSWINSKLNKTASSAAKTETTSTAKVNTTSTSKTSTNSTVNKSTASTSKTSTDSTVNKSTNSTAKTSTTANSSAIKAGDKVKINTGAIYGGLSTTRGKKVPDSVIAGKKYTVVKLQTNNGVSEALLNEINSWVAVKSLTK